jgi:hypothetical protein
VLAEYAETCMQLGDTLYESLQPRKDKTMTRIITEDAMTQLFHAFTEDTAIAAPSQSETMSEEAQQLYRYLTDADALRTPAEIAESNRRVKEADARAKPKRDAVGELFEAFLS